MQMDRIQEDEEQKVDFNGVYCCVVERSGEGFVYGPSRRAGGRKIYDHSTTHG